MKTLFSQSGRKQATHQHNNISKKANNVKPISWLDMWLSRRVKLVEVTARRGAAKYALEVK